MPIQVEVSVDRQTLDPSRGFRSPDELLEAVANAERHPSAIDERLRPLAAAGSDEHGTYSNPAGGFLVPDSMAPFVLSVQDGGEEDPAVGRTLPIPMSTPVVHIAARVDKNHATSVSGGLCVYRKPDTAEWTASRGEYERIRLEVNDATGLAFGTNDLAMDSFPSFAAVLGASYRHEFAAMFLEERLRGTGVGEMEGILTSPASITVSKESGQSADTLVSENVIKMRARCWGYRRAVWIANHDAIPQLTKLTITIGTAGVQIPAWQPGNDDGTPDTLLGATADLQRISLHARRRRRLVAGQLVAISRRHVQTARGGQLPARALPGTRNHVQVLDAQRGAGWWRSPLTPRRSTTTLSPFVTLAARA